MCFDRYEIRSHGGYGSPAKITQSMTENQENHEQLVTSHQTHGETFEKTNTKQQNMVLTPMGHPKSKTRRPTKHPRKPEKPKNTNEPCEKHYNTLEKTRKKTRNTNDFQETQAV